MSTVWGVTLVVRTRSLKDLFTKATLRATIKNMQPLLLQPKLYYHPNLHLEMEVVRRNAS